MAGFAHTRILQGATGKDFTTPGFDDESQVLAKIKAGATSWRAMEIIYKYVGGEGDTVADFWVNMRNAQAVRNRKKMLETLLEQEIQTLHRQGKGTAENPIRVLSLACGSAQAVLEVIGRFTEQQIVVELLLIDWDDDAAPLIEHYASKCGVTNRVSFEPEHVFKFQHKLQQKGFVPDIVEMAGLIDYFEANTIVKLASKIRDVLPENGTLLTCHIHDNAEKDFLTYVIYWGVEPVMFYRSREELDNLITQAGFKTQCFTEPHKIHTICVGHK